MSGTGSERSSALNFRRNRLKIWRRHGGEYAKGRTARSGRDDLSIKIFQFGRVDKMADRRASISRETNETNIQVSIDLDPVQPQSIQISTGIGFLDHVSPSFRLQAVQPVFRCILPSPNTVESP